MKLKENDVTFVEEADDDMNVVADEVILLEVEDMVDNEGDVADDDKDVVEVEALEKNINHQNYFV